MIYYRIRDERKEIEEGEKAREVEIKIPELRVLRKGILTKLD